MRCHLQISSYRIDLMSVNGPISPKHCYEMDSSFYSFYWLDSLEIYGSTTTPPIFITHCKKNSWCQASYFTLRSKTSNIKCTPRFDLLTDEFSKQVSKTRLIHVLENWRYLELLSVAELVKAHLTCSIVGYIYHAIQLILQFHRYYVSSVPNSWYW